MLSLLLAASVSQAASFDFDGFSDASTFEQKALSTYAKNIKGVGFQNIADEDGNVETLALVAVTFGSTNNVVALNEGTCKGAISDGCFDGYEISAAAVDISDDVAAVWAWDDRGDFTEVGELSVSTTDDGGELSIDLSDYGVSIIGGGEYDEDVEAAASPGLIFGAGVAIGALGVTAVVVTIAAIYNAGYNSGHEDGKEEGSEECPSVTSYTPVDLNLMFDASSIIDLDNACIATL